MDLDHCRNAETGEVEPWATEIVEELDSYTEVSPSGDGLHIIIQGKLPSGRRRKGNIEMYDSVRYFTMTGDHVAGTPATVEERDALLKQLHVDVFSDAPAPTTMAKTSITDTMLIKQALGAKNGAKFQALWAGGLLGLRLPALKPTWRCARS